MRISRIFPALLAVSLLAAPAFADPGGRADPSEQAGAGKKKGHDKQKGQKKGDWKAKREARLVEEMKKEGISETKGKRVVAVLRKFRDELKAARAEGADKAKFDAIKERRKAEVAKILTPAEAAKVEEIVKRGKRHGHARRGKDKS
jgi:Spy/CpxP family protein refolding chaperone